MSVEDRVTAALHALADGTAPPVDGEQRLTARLRREHRNRRLAAVIGTVASVVAVAGVVSLTDVSGRSAPAPAPFASLGAPSAAPTLPAVESAGPAVALPDVATPAPSYPPPAAGVGGPSTMVTLEPGGRYGFRDARTGVLLRTGAPVGYTVQTVAAAGDGRTFYAAATKGECGAVRLQRLALTTTRTGARVVVSDVPGAGGQAGQISSIAASADGTRLAYAISDGDDPDYGCLVHKLRVVDLRTGVTQTWRGEGVQLFDLDWAPDDHTLLMHAQGCCGDYQPGLSRLDTRAPGRSLTKTLTTPGTDRSSGCAAVSNTASSRTEVFAAQECLGEDPDRVHVVVLDPVTGRVVRRVATVVGVDATSFTVSQDGRHLLIADFQAGPPVRVDDGVVSRVPARVEQAAW